MPTNDERREVARKLRNIGYLGNFDDVVKAIGFPNDMTWRMDEFNARLADLIDPDTIPDKPDLNGRPLSEPVKAQEGAAYMPSRRCAHVDACTASKGVLGDVCPIT